MDFPRVAVLMVTFNAQSYLGDCFDSLTRTDYLKDRWHIIVVDNASHDDTIAILKTWQKKLPHIHIIESKENTAFAGGNNIAAAYAQQFKPDYLVLLNQDTVVDPNWLQGLVLVGESDARIGVAQSLLLLHPSTSPQPSPYKGEGARTIPLLTKERLEPALSLSKGDVYINSLGNEIHFLGFGFCKGYRTPYHPIILSSESSEIPYASGAAMLVRNSLYQKIGLFDERFFMYHEDLDLCWRARLMSWRIVLAPKSVVYHKYSFSKSIKKYYFMERNRLITIFQNYHIITLIIVSPFVLLMELGLLFQSLRTGWWHEKLRVYGYFFHKAHWHAMLQKRKEVQSSRVVPEHEAVKLFTGRITYQEISSPLLTYVANPFFNAVWWIIRGIMVW